MPTLYVVLLVLAVILGGAALCILIIQAGEERKARSRAERERRKAISKRWDEIVENLLQRPSDGQLLAEAFQFLAANRGYIEAGYRLALDLVALSEGEKQNKVFALNVGRMHYSMHREDRAPTIYDEAAIENDIKARC